MLAKVGIVSSRQLKKMRRYAYVGMFVVAAVLTPPDVITQCGLAFPLIILYEISIVAARFVETKPVETCKESCPCDPPPCRAAGQYPAARSRSVISPIAIRHQASASPRRHGLCVPKLRLDLRLEVLCLYGHQLNSKLVFQELLAAHSVA